MKKKIYLFTLTFIIALFILFFYIQRNVGNKFDDNLSFLRNIIPKEYRPIIKETVFVFKNQEILKKKLKLVEDKLIFQKKLITRILESADNFTFQSSENFDDYKESNNKEFDLTLYSNENLNLMGPRGYLAIDDKFLYLITGTGSLMYVQLEDFEKKSKIIFNKIKTNFLKINGGVDFTHFYSTAVKSILIKDNHVYVSQVKKQSKDCFVSVILKAELNLLKMEFKELFNTNHCIPFYTNQSGGNLADYKNDKILFTTGAFKTFEDMSDTRPAKVRNLPMDKDSLIGKIMSIDINSGDAEIISMGHRNIQGLFYDKYKDIIYSTEHGPTGGDEINVNSNLSSEEIENYGWPIASYGVQPDYWDENKKNYMAKFAPYYKSHKDHGFVEPLIWFTPALGITQITKGNTGKTSKKDIFYFGAMGWDIEEGDLSIHKLSLNNDGTIYDHSVIPIGDRVRDLLFDKNKEKLYFFLENSGSIGVLSKK